MDDPGYGIYQDPRLQPPDGYYHNPTPTECPEGCCHAGACKRVWCQTTSRSYPEDTSVETLALILGCESCEEWAE